ncbi:MAG: hypothetical protein ACHP7N_00220 [Caulobacterales bacterium]
MSAQPSHASDQLVSIVRLEHAADGYLHGFGQPFLQARLHFSLPASLDWTNVDAALRAALPEAPPPAASDEPLAGALDRLLYWTPEFQRSAADAVFEAGRILWRAADGAELTVIALPTLDPNIATAALNIVIGLINDGIGAAVAAPDLLAALHMDIQTLGQAWRESAVSPAMMLYLKAAHQRGIPWLRLGTTTAYQIGYGVKARWLDRSLSDATSLLSARFVNNKIVGASMLRQVGLPVPDHLAVSDVEMAVLAAETLGYPVVVKPLDSEGGVGVHVGLKEPEAVRTAYFKARRYSERILVEKFVEGRDYRMSVFQGRLIWAVERVPGSVTGDGHSTVRQLTDQLNADPRRGNNPTAKLKKLTFDEEAIEWLAQHGLDGDTVPAAGQTIRLRGAANIARGGVAVDVFHEVHADNRLLAERAARALGMLDMAGVDLIIPDIGQTWRESGAAICEVNAQPDFFTTIPEHVYGKIIEGLVQGDGRIPIALTIGASAPACTLVARLVAAAGVRVGLATPECVLIDDENVLPLSPDLFTGARLLLGDTTVAAAIVAANDTVPASTGMPFDCCTVVALAGSRLGSSREEFYNLARSLLPMSTGKIVINAEDPDCVALAEQINGGQLIFYAATEHAALRDHRAKGGAAVWIETSTVGANLIIASGLERSVSIQLNAGSQSAQALDCSVDDIALAAAVAGALGCDENQLRKGLAGVRVRA